jgi:hypothetical protein
MANLSHITRRGLPRIEWVPFGMHACHFYRRSEQLVAALLPHAVAGLRGNNDQQMNEVMHAHHCAMERLNADWQVFAVPKFLEL